MLFLFFQCGIIHEMAEFLWISSTHSCAVVHRRLKHWPKKIILSLSVEYFQSNCHSISPRPSSFLEIVISTLTNFFFRSMSYVLYVICRCLICKGQKIQIQIDPISLDLFKFFMIDIIFSNFFIFQLLKIVFHEIHRIYRICWILFWVLFSFKIDKNSIVQIL